MALHQDSIVKLTGIMLGDVFEFMSSINTTFCYMYLPDGSDA